MKETKYIPGDLGIAYIAIITLIHNEVDFKQFLHKERIV